MRHLSDFEHHELKRKFSIYHQSFYPGADKDAAAVSGNISYASQYLKAGIEQSWIGSDYIAEAGYIRRTGIFEITPSVSYLFYPSGSKRIISHGPAANLNAIFDPEFNLTDRETQLSYIIGWQNKSQLSVSMEEQFIKLSSAFDPTNTGGEKLNAGKQFLWNSVQAGFTSADFTPLPVLGVPNWWPDQDAAFYADASVFRPKRIRLPGQPQGQRDG